MSGVSGEAAQTAQPQSLNRVLALRSWHADWSGLRVAVLGLGVTGFSVADTLVELGCTVRVIFGSADPARERLLAVIGAQWVCVHTGEDQRDELIAFAPDLVVASPGYAARHPALIAAEQQGVPVWGDIELGWRLRDKTERVADWMCVTGTNGKTTTAQLTAHMLVAGGLRAAPVGNIGVPVLDALRDPRGYDVLVVELSSFQLHRLGESEVSPYASVCLNIAEDHIDWHGSMAAYAAAKARVYARVQAACVYNRADSVTEQLVRDAEVIEGARAISFGLDSPPPSGFGVVDGLLVDRAYHAHRYDEAYELVTLTELSECDLAAPHLVQNILAAAALARARGVSPAQIRRAVLEFRLDHHRMQRLGRYAGVHWVDDSKATNAHAADASLRAFDRVVWIVGGVLKGIDLETLVARHAHRLRAAVVIGADREPVLAAFRRHAPNVPVRAIRQVQTKEVMVTAVAQARALAQLGDTVLLSPAAASMDQFTDYADRGLRFQAEVRALGEGHASEGNVSSERS